MTTPADQQPLTAADVAAEAPSHRRRWVVSGVLVALLVAAYVAGYLLARDRVPAGTSVRGIDIGGLSTDDAEAKLAAELPAELTDPVTLRTGGENWQITPTDAGLAADPAATVESASGGNPWSPVRIVKVLFGFGGAVEPVAAVDRAALESSVAGVAAAAALPAVDGSVGFAAGEVVSTTSSPGRTVDEPATADAVEDAWPTETEVTMVVDAVEPMVDDEEVARAVSEFAEPAMSAPVDVDADGRRVVLTPTQLSEALTMPATEGRLEPVVDGAKLLEVGAAEFATLGQQATEATIRIVDGAPQITPSSAGLGVDATELATAMLPALTQTGTARVALTGLQPLEPELTTAEAQALGVTSVVGEFTTRFPYAEYRNVNIGVAAGRINNTLLLPGDTFSLNGIVGERTEANGFVTGTVISDGRFREELGGGVSQVATTTFNAMFFAGLEDVQHRPHSFWISRYPEGREATVAWGKLDMSFKNNTPYGVVVQTVFGRSAPGRQGTLTVRMWSSPHFEVGTTTSPRSNGRTFKTITDSSADCVPQAGVEGFQVTVTRQTSLAGAVVKDESWTTVYNPADAITCSG